MCLKIGGMLYTVAFIISVLPEVAIAFSRGAPNYQCDYMKPGHGAQSTDASPFSINVFSDKIAPGSPIEVNISSSNSKIQIMGIFVQAKSLNQNKYVGSFIPVPTTRKVCSGNTGLTHRQRLMVPNLELVWNAPSDLIENDDIIFNVTVVQNIQVFWQGIESLPIKVTAIVDVITDSTTKAPSIVWQPVHMWDYKRWWSVFTGASWNG